MGGGETGQRDERKGGSVRWRCSERRKIARECCNSISPIRLEQPNIDEWSMWWVKCTDNVPKVYDESTSMCLFSQVSKSGIV